MEQAYIADVNYLEIVKRRLPLCLLIGLILLLATGGLAIGLPSVYRSRAVILIEQQTIPQDLVRSVVTSYADERIQTISQRVLTNNNLNNIITKYDLYAEKRRKYPLEVIQKDMRDDIKVQTISADIVDPRTGAPRPATIAFELSYENKSPDLAQKVANEVVSLFLNENLKERSANASETLSFLDSESGRLKKDISDLESKLAVFKEKNGKSLPELQVVNIELMNNTHRELSELNARLQSAQEQRVYLESELAQQQPMTTAFTETGERVLGSADRLKVVESKLITLTSRYGASHPDVVSAKKELESLRADVGKAGSTSELERRRVALASELAADEKKYSSEHPDIKRLRREVAELAKQISERRTQTVARKTPSNERPDNPVYIQLQARLQAEDAELNSLNQQRAELKGRIAAYEANLQSAPQVEKEYRALTRDYENAQLKYKETIAKKQEAELAKNMESEQKGERFELIEPPVTPEKPAKPNRIAIGLLGVLFSIVGSIGSGTLMESLDTRVYGRAGVLRILGVPPLAVIPVIDNAEVRRSRKFRRVVSTVIALLTILAAAAIVHFFFIPLDVLFYRALRIYGA